MNFTTTWIGATPRRRRLSSTKHTPHEPLREPLRPQTRGQLARPWPDYDSQQTLL
jgi:hypothetical protein